ncbi:diguanylate cyclase (GGDEF)-like protein [Jatrophihabitans sp. GAS493]|uniref:putative bifunctional diguanylate cyclase/phosphodiesterase n=1 Tax=Jatrophihabitans sp. GAS493 TaxID=1907575 RepID=UPI000BC01726|nr:EAL domain-containing protein [Jatrophihabitans sp. GAS493]SOD72592.1 diguanylate cyclase (GGDEF)-like protein [Jatrophihabitans sp. GAS493]
MTGTAYFAGGTLALVGVTLVRNDLPHPILMALISLGCMIIGAFLYLRVRLLTIRAYSILVAAGTVIIASSVYLVGPSNQAVNVATLLMFPMVGAFFSFSWATALCHMVFIEFCAATAFIAQGRPDSDVLILQGAMLGVGLAVGWLTRAAAASKKDSLTGLANRRWFDERLRDLIGDAKAGDPPMSIVFMDFDRFKQINDTIGHAEGDRVLMAAADAWTKIVPPGCLLARPGGDEFAMILPGYSANRAAEIADVMRESILHETTCSAGVAELRLDDSKAMLMARADVALYEAKSRGGNLTCQHGVVNTEGAEAIHAGLAAGEFEVYYQPIIDLRFGLVTGDEALIRWNDPTRGLVPPNDFIPLAEANGAIHALGAWILREACRGTAEYIKATGVPRRISVNASGHELKRLDYAQRVADVLAETGLDPSSLVIEVTESTFDADHPNVIAMLAELREQGIDIAIDDFGTGYSSLSRLHNIPANVLKIDRSFVSAIPEDGAEVPVLRSIVALAEALGLRIIAEGVETVHQAQVLADLGCSHAQGYHFGRPNPVQQANTKSWHVHAA